MADGTKIEWCDATWNIINGCTVVSPGCTNCYAMRLAATRFKGHPSREGLARMHNGHPQWTGQVLLNKRVALDPYRWSRPRRIFVCAHGDLFHENVPDAWIDFVFYVALLCPQHTFQILTKRPARMREYMQIVLDEPQEATAFRFAVAAKHAGLEDLPRDKRPELHWPPRNCWLGTSVEDQQRADERIPDLLATPAAIRWLSCEPLLGPVNLNHVKFVDREMEGGGHEQGWESALNGIRFNIWAADDEDPNVPGFPKLDWVVVGGESGPDSRPMHPDWARKLRDQCDRSNVAMLFKQWGDWRPVGPIYSDSDTPESLEAMEVAASDEGRDCILAPDGGLWPECQPPDGSWVFERMGKKRAGRLLDGVQHDGYPS